MKGYIVDAISEVKDSCAYIVLFGRLENNQSFSIIKKVEPYFFIKSSDFPKVKKLLEKFKVKESNCRNFNNEKVMKISVSAPGDLNKLSQILHKLDLETYEADIKSVARFIIDHNILGSIDIKGEYQPAEKVDRVYIEPEITPSDYYPSLKMISLDIESDKKTGNLFCIGLYGNNYKKNFIVSDKKLSNSISVQTEEECLRKFREELIKIDPDIITGWSVIDFDLDYLKILFRKHKIPFDLGRTNAEGKIRIESGFFRSSKAEFEGRQVLDALNLIRDPFIKEAPSIKNAEFDSYSLEDVSQAILGTGKLIKGKDRHIEIEKLYRKDPQKIVDYNLMDCQLVYDILEKTKIIELAIERSQLTGMSLDRITASIAAFDSLYIREARNKNLVSPTSSFNKKETKILGGYVKQPNPGIYNNILIMDFKSLYPSIIKTFNIDPASFTEKREKNVIESPNGAFFRNQEGILPEIINKLHHARESAKKEGKELANYAIKIIMNSFYGVLASQNSRYFNFNMAGAITHFAQMIIKLTAQEIEKLGYKVIYSDTDSVFIMPELNKEKSNQLGKEIEKHINKFYQEYVENKYHRKSFLELEFKKLYLSLMFPSVRANKEEKAAKKRYAGLIEKNGVEELEITGLEAIRGDWTEAAQDFQRELLMKTFHDEPVEQFIRSFIKNINEGKLDKKLIYRKSIRKDLADYTKTTPPHVKAARQLDTLDSNVIEYYVTMAGPEPIQKLKHKIDYKHYIKKQIEPIANQILSLFGKNFEDLSSKSKQSKLF